MGDTLLIIAPEKFRDEELFDTKSVLEESGFVTVIASKTAGVKKGMMGATAKAEISLGKVDVNDYKAIIFIGGPGASFYFENAAALNIARESIKNNKILAAICIAPIILGNAGVLVGKNVTCWDDPFRTYSKKLKAKGAKYTGKEIETDGRIITANGPEASKLFGKAIVDALNN